MSKTNRQNEYNRLVSIGKEELIPQSLLDEFKKPEPVVEPIKKTTKRKK